MVNSHVDRIDIDDSIVAKCLEKGINFFDTAEAYMDGKQNLIKVNVKKLWEERSKKLKWTDLTLLFLQRCTGLERMLTLSTTLTENILLRV